MSGMGPPPEPFAPATPRHIVTLLPSLEDRDRPSLERPLKGRGFGSRRVNSSLLLLVEYRDDGHRLGTDGPDLAFCSIVRKAKRSIIKRPILAFARWSMAAKYPSEAGKRALRRGREPDVTAGLVVKLVEHCGNGPDGIGGDSILGTSSRRPPRPDGRLNAEVVMEQQEKENCGTQLGSPPINRAPGAGPRVRAPMDE